MALMSRPKKDPKSLRAEILRVPVSEAEKSYIYEAAIATEGEFARWARPILLKAAEDWHATQGGKGPMRANDGKKQERIGASAP
jgi:hypothetical protein